MGWHPTLYLESTGIGFRIPVTLPRISDWEIGSMEGVKVSRFVYKVVFKAGALCWLTYILPFLSILPFFILVKNCLLKCVICVAQRKEPDSPESSRSKIVYVNNLGTPHKTCSFGDALTQPCGPRQSHSDPYVCLWTMLSRSESVH